MRPETALPRLLVVLCALLLHRAIGQSGCVGGNCTVAPSAQYTSSSNSTTPSVFLPTVVPATTLAPSTAPPADKGSVQQTKGRAINFTLHDQNSENVLSVKGKSDDLSDVSMDDDEEDTVGRTPITALKANERNESLGFCVKGGLTYSEGDKIEDGCDTICTCSKGRMDCTERCTGPFFRKGKKVDDPLCTAKDVDDPCCAILVCAADTETEPLEMCSFQNKTFQRGDIFNDGCTRVCTCEAAGKMNCKPRCPPTNKTSDRCVEVPSPEDACCKMVLCDVTLGDQDHDKPSADIPKIKIISAKYLDPSTIRLKFDSKVLDNSSMPHVEISENKEVWRRAKLTPDGMIEKIQKASIKYIRLENTVDVVTVSNAETTTKDIVSKKEDISKMCSYKGTSYKFNEEFHDGCDSLCVCLDAGVKCLKIECPTYFGLDVMDPSCLEWETVPPDFKASYPNCCPEHLRCKNNGSCLHEGIPYQNWQEIPVNVTGCDKKCYCESGKVECQSACPPVTTKPPNNLPCLPEQASLTHLPDDDCCLYWMCTPPPTPPGTDNKLSSKPDATVKDDKKPNGTEHHFNRPQSTMTKNFTGPLLTYANPAENATSPIDESHLQQLNDTAKRPETSNMDKTPYLGPFLHPSSFAPTAKKPVPPQTHFVGPFNPDYKPPVESGPINARPDANLPQQPQQPFPQPPNKIIIKPEPGKITSQEELINLIKNHPELSKFPSGSIFEVHDFPANIPPARPQFPNQNQINANTKVPQTRPQPRPEHIPNYGSIPEEDPNGLTIEDVLKQIQKAGHPIPYAPFPQNGQFAHPNSRFPTAPQHFVPNNQYNIVAPPQIQHPFAGNNSGGFGAHFPPGIFNVPHHHGYQDDIIIQHLEAIDGETIRMVFTVPPVIVGLRGRVEVRYTNKPNDDQSKWERQVFAPPNDLIETPQLVFELVGLKPDTEYQVKIAVILRDLDTMPTSRVTTVRTLHHSATTLPPLIPVEPELKIVNANTSWVTVAWRKFSEDEMQFIDGIQLRFKEIEGKVYAATPLIHRVVTEYTLEKLKPNTQYEIGIFFVPFHGQTTELHSEKMVHFTTASLVDIYGFNVTMEITQIKPTSVEITWSGVPYPEDKYVNIYRAIYQSDSGKGDYSTFKVAKRDSPTKTVIMDLKPGTRYRLWLEIYLTNGKIKTSNVQDFITKPRTAPAIGASSQQGKLESGDEFANQKGDYYGPLVIVAILAAIAIMSTLILLLILVKRNQQNKANITTPCRVSQSAYDNPTYKVEIQQETMDL